MAFRKKVKSNWSPSFSCFGCNEPQFAPVSGNSLGKKIVYSKKTLDEINKTCLPEFSPDTLISSGRKIDGSVSFEPSDRANIESLTVDTLSRYAESFKEAPGATLEETQPIES